MVPKSILSLISFCLVSRVCCPTLGSQRRASGLEILRQPLLCQHQEQLYALPFGDAIAQVACPLLPRPGVQKTLGGEQDDAGGDEADGGAA